MIEVRIWFSSAQDIVFNYSGLNRFKREELTAIYMTFLLKSTEMKTLTWTDS
jgi:hypothetical protein